MRKLIIFSSSTYKFDSTEIEQICEKYGVEVYKSNIDENPMLSDKYSIRYYPTFLLLEDGRELWRKSNITTVKLEELLNE